jgi:hypothetical protein
VEGGQLVYEGVTFGPEDLPTVTAAIVPEIVDALRAVTGGGFRVLRYLAWRTYHNPTANREFYSEKWHSDANRTDLHHVFVFLNDVTPDDGGTIVADRQTTHAACRAGYRNRNAYGGAASILAALDQHRGVCGPAGTAYLLNPNLCLHRAGIPAPGRYRDVLHMLVVASPKVDLFPGGPGSVSWIDRQQIGF